MNRVMIERWNAVVKPGDTVFHLGDFTLEGEDTARKFFDQINGFIQVLANPWHHDKRWLPALGKGSLSRVMGLPPLVVIEAEGFGDRPLSITLCHYPLARWDRQHHGGLMLFGHEHGRYKMAGRAHDVGVDNNNFTPVNLLEIINRFLEVPYGRHED